MVHAGVGVRASRHASNLADTPSVASTEVIGHERRSQGQCDMPILRDVECMEKQSSNAKHICKLIRRTSISFRLADRMASAHHARMRASFVKFRFEFLSEHLMRFKNQLLHFHARF